MLSSLHSVEIGLCLQVLTFIVFCAAWRFTTKFPVQYISKWEGKAQITQHCLRLKNTWANVDVP